VYIEEHGLFYKHIYIKKKNYIKANVRFGIRFLEGNEVKFPKSEIRQNVVKWFSKGRRKWRVDEVESERGR